MFLLGGLGHWGEWHVNYITRIKPEKQGSYSFIKNPLLSRHLMYIIIRNIHILAENVILLRSGERDENI
ncbi:hypothetical protein JCM37173_09780 [Allocoprococcus similis]